MKTLLKAFFPEKENYNDFISFLESKKIDFDMDYKYPEYKIILNNTEHLKEIYENFGEFIFSTEDETLMSVLHRTILKTSITLSGAESCTGGLISKYLTDNSGASKYFKYSVVSYSNESKMRILNLEEETIDTKGVVSKAAIISMLNGIEYIYPTDISYAVSGIAGPDGWTDDKPVGTVFIGISQYGRRDIKRYQFTGTRWEIRRYATWTVLLKILNLVKKELDKE